MPPVAAGQIIDSYRIVRQIGEGGMGAVYEAVHTVLGQRVAIKVLLSDFKAQPSLLDRFINEARAAGLINHPGIVKVFDLGRLDDGVPWLSMEYLEGQSLAARLHTAIRRTRQPLGMVEYWIIGDIASALAAAHAKSIIHRDLKPANVMIVPDPATLSGDRAKVLDFGVAKLHSEAQQLTKRGSILGTPSYMALEQFRDSTEVDGQADVFSLGIIAYELLTGRRPHSGMTHYEVMGARMLDPIPPLQQLVPSLPSSVVELVMRMLEREPANRPTMNEVEFEVRRTLGLPPPRQSGWNHAVLVPSPSEPEIEETNEPAAANAAKAMPHFDSNASTPDAPEHLPEVIPFLAQTPSSEKAAGEISPPSAVRIPSLISSAVPVPISISSMPSVPVPISSVVRAGPEESTAKPAPAPLVSEAEASPSSPTKDGRRNRQMYWLGAALALTVAGGLGAVWLKTSRERGPVPRAGVKNPTQKPDPSPNPMTVPPPPVAEPKIPATPTGEAGTATNGAMKEAPPKPTASSQPTTTNKGSRRTCEPQEIMPSCVMTPVMPDKQRQVIYAAVEQSGAQWCPGEPLVLAGLPGDPEISTEPPSLRGKFQLQLTLRSMLRGKTVPHKVKLLCKPR